MIIVDLVSVVVPVLQWSTQAKVGDRNELHCHVDVAGHLPGVTLALLDGLSVPDRGT